ncbi:MAG TPA: lipocalin family protein [Chitinophagaceae bacterium]
MKPHFAISIACALLIACNNNKAAQETPAGEPQKQQEVASTSEANQPAGDGIAGLWKLKLETYDDNGNKVLDEAERKKGFKNNYTFRFNADGSCQIQGTFKGRYEEKTENGNKMLYVYRNRVVGEEDKDPAPDVYRIISMSKTELVLLEREGNLTFWVFERAG